jgi:hypothetical protein
MICSFINSTVDALNWSEVIALEKRRATNWRNPNIEGKVGCVNTRASRQIVLFLGEVRYKLDDEAKWMSLDRLLHEELRQDIP